MLHIQGCLDLLRDKGFNPVSRFGRGHGGRCGCGRGRGGRGRVRGGERPVPYTGSSHYPVRQTRTLNFVCMSGMNEESTPSR